MSKPNWVFLSPHLDDAVLSCGGMIRELAIKGSRVEIWTICAGDPPAGPRPPFAMSLEQRWQTGPESVAARRLEDRAACARVGATAVHFDLPDCIYRRLPDGRPLVDGENDLWQPLPEGEIPLAESLAEQIKARLEGNCHLAAPLGLGDHIDHRLVRAAALGLNIPIYFYPDYPYAARPGVDIQKYLLPGWRRRRFVISPAALDAWRSAIELYPSQISSLWRDLDEMHNAFQSYVEQGGGRSLWIKPE